MLLLLLPPPLLLVLVAQLKGGLLLLRSTCRNLPCACNSVLGQVVLCCVAAEGLRRSRRLAAHAFFLHPVLVPPPQKRAGAKGFGLFATEDLKSGQFVIEYIGEVLEEEEYLRR